MMQTQRPPCLSPKLANLNNEEVRAAEHTLHKQVTDTKETNPAEARQLYREFGPALQRELCWRRRFELEDSNIALLLVTVGSQSDTPVNAVLAWNANHVVFLPSEKTRSTAIECIELLGLRPGSYSIQVAGDGEQPLAIYQIIHQEWKQHGRPLDVVVDLSGGLKTMSAAAAVASFILPAGRCVYLATDQEQMPDGFPPLWFRSRVIELDNPYQVMGDIERERALALARAGRFRSASDMFDQLCARSGMRIDSLFGRICSALAYIDELKLDKAEKELTAFTTDAERDRKVAVETRVWAVVSQDTIEWAKARTRGLAAVIEMLPKRGNTGDPVTEITAIGGKGGADLIAFLLAFARRRLQQQDHDIAGLFAYRAVEGVVQRAMVTAGFNPSDMDWHRLYEISGCSDQQSKEKLLGKIFRRAEASPVKDPETKVDRGVALAILANGLKHEAFVTEDLKQLDNLLSARNRSILAHGLSTLPEATAGRMVAEAERLFAQLIKSEGLDPNEVKQRHAESKFELFKSPNAVPPT